LLPKTKNALVVFATLRERKKTLTERQRQQECDMELARRKTVFSAEVLRRV
jgi:hypothetical protein